jgi:hypothetical protein
VDEKQAHWESFEAALKCEPRAAFGKTGLDGRADARVRVLGAMFIMASARMRGIKMMVNQNQLCASGMAVGAAAGDGDVEGQGRLTDLAGDRGGTPRTSTA